MVGRGTLIVIIGFSIIFGTAAQYWNKNSTRAIENFVDYYDSTSAHTLAISAVNILADSMFWNQGTANLTNINTSYRQFGDGSFKFQTQPDTVDGEYDVLATAVSKYVGYRGNMIYDTVQILMQPGRFNQWAYFTDKDSNIYWTTGETLNGRYHTNGTLYLDGAPVFTGNVSTGKGLTTRQAAPRLVSPGSLPDGNGNRLITPNYQTGVIIPMPNTLANYESISNVYKISDTSNSGSGYAYDVYVTLSGNSMSYYTTKSTVTPVLNWYGRVVGSTVTQVSQSATTNITDLSQLGDAGNKGLGSVVLVQNGDLHISGQINGRVTFVAEQGSGATARVSSSSYNKTIEGKGVDVDLTYGNGSSNHNAGNVLIDGDLTYTTMPSAGGDDLLGLVADNSIAIAKQSTNNLTIDASLFARQGKFFNSMYQHGAMGTLTMFGSMAQETRGAVGTIGTAGYSKNYSYDNRFQRTSTSPPMSPSTGSYNIVYWRE